MASGRGFMASKKRKSEKEPLARKLDLLDGCNGLTYGLHPSLLLA